MSEGYRYFALILAVFVVGVSFAHCMSKPITPEPPETPTGVTVTDLKTRSLFKLHDEKAKITCYGGYEALSCLHDTAQTTFPGPQ